jgi:molybdate transport system substrate-binding protein
MWQLQMSDAVNAGGVRCRAAAPFASLAVALVAASVALAGCNAAADSSGNTPAGTTVVVLAASSLTESLTAIAKDFEEDHPGTDVQLSFAASSTVVTQVNQGAPADLIALAGTSLMGQLDKALVAKDGTRTFARNTLEVATPPSNPGNVDDIKDLSRPTLKVVLCAPAVPCGKAAAQVLAAVGVAAHVVSYETDVRATLAKVQLGEADAAVVYHSDVVAAGKRVRGVQIPASVNQTLDYPLVRLSDDPTAVAFANYLLSDRGQRRLRDNGFLAP